MSCTKNVPPSIITLPVAPPTTQQWCITRTKKTTPIDKFDMLNEYMDMGGVALHEFTGNYIKIGLVTDINFIPILTNPNDTIVAGECVGYCTPVIPLTSSTTIGDLICNAGVVSGAVRIIFNDIQYFQNGTEIQLQVSNTPSPISTNVFIAPLSGFTYNPLTQIITITDINLISTMFELTINNTYTDCSQSASISASVLSYTNLIGAPTIGAQTGDTETYTPPPLNLCSPTFGFYTGEFATAFTPFSFNEVIATITSLTLDVAYDVDWGDASPHFTGTVLAIGNNVVSPAHLYADGNYNPTITLTNPNGVVSVQTFPTLQVVAGQFDDCFIGNEFATNSPSVTLVNNTNCGVGEIEVNLGVGPLTYLETYNVAGNGQPYGGDIEYTIKWNGVTMLTFTELGAPSYTINQSFITNNVLPTNTIEVIAVSKDLSAGFNQVLGSFTQTIISHN